MRLNLLKFADGERFPVLMGEDGIPLFTPTVYTTTMLRSKAGSYATLVSKLRGLMVLYAWAKSSGFDIEERFQQLHFLSIDEIGSLISATKIRYRDISETVEPEVKKSSGRVVSLEDFRKRATKPEGLHVDSGTAALRQHAIVHYLEWLAQEALAKAAHHPDAAGLRAEVKRMERAIRARMTKVKKYGTAMPREGLAPEVQKRVHEVISPDSPENPWKGAHSRARNCALISLLMGLGPRCGEALVLRTMDIDLGVSEARIRRAPDEAADPRVWKPNAKTLSRDLVFDDDLHRVDCPG